MNEKSLHKIWKSKSFKRLDFKDIEGNAIEILNFGTYNTNAGPDFLLAKVKINEIILFGDIEIHVKSSDWDVHQHSNQKDYKTTILHVVYEHDKDILGLNKAGISTLELKDYINLEPSDFAQFSFIPCEDNLQNHRIDSNFTQKIILEKLNKKYLEIEQSLLENKNDYEAVLFQRIAYSFGLKTNADIFLDIAKNTDFSIIKKTSQNIFQLESILFGKAGLLEDGNMDSKAYNDEYKYLNHKFSLSEINFKVKFLRLRPANFPTIRLSQLANLYHKQPKMFSKIINAENLKDIYALFEGVSVSEYWKNHYVFGKETTLKSEKKLSESFVHLIVINTIIPILFAYHKNSKSNKIPLMLDWLKQIRPEENTIVDSWRELNVNFNSALDTQAFLDLYKEYCTEKKCLSCDLYFFNYKQ